MGREIKRVIDNFDWPLGKVWEGYLTPMNLRPLKCRYCEETGYNQATKEIADSFYDSNNFNVTWTYNYGFDPKGNPTTKHPWGIIGNRNAWYNKITQDEVQALLDNNRLWELTHIWIDNRWKPRTDNYTIPAEFVNELISTNKIRYDGISRYILIETRAKRLGVYGLCTICNGEGYVFINDEQKKSYENWEPTPVPEGDWWQVWENVSEGSPVTPAFSTKKELIEYLVQYGDITDQKHNRGGWDRQATEEFINKGYKPSFIMEVNND